jgi:2-polyprenyl-3-methyl-5-hydroxy-6-metoxy-1,4-benzoquinol methylase
MTASQAMNWGPRANRVLSRLLGLEVRKADSNPLSKIPMPDFPPGTAVASMFFDKYPRFYDTSKTSSGRGRLNLRYEAMIAQNRDVLEGKRVLDIASHDGRWSFAALQSGAEEVIGIEARDELVASARETFAHYGVEPERYRFIAGDVFEVLEREIVEVDIVLCLGFMYHTLRYNELMKHFRNLNPTHLIIDTIVDKSPRPVIQVWTEESEGEGNAVLDRYSYGVRVMSGCPSPAALRRMLGAYDFEIVRFSNWAALKRDNPGVGIGGYENGKRITVRCRSLTGESGK